MSHLFTDPYEGPVSKDGIVLTQVEQHLVTPKEIYLQYNFV